MNKQQCEALINAIEKAFAESGLADMYEGAKRLRRWIDAQYPSIRAAESRSSLEDYLTCKDEKWEAEIEPLITLILAAPKLLDTFMDESALHAASKIPIAPIGRPSELSLSTRHEIVKNISYHHSKGMGVGLAQAKVSRELGIAKRTVQRAWHQRAGLADTAPITMKDFWAVLRDTAP